MERLERMWAALCSTAFAIAAAPALALAQSSGGPSNPSGGPLNSPNAPAREGGSGWLWLLLALAVIAIIWYAMSQRRTATRTR